jgi:hypothetical protein
MATNAPARVKKLINAVEDIVPESLRGLQAAHPDLVTVDLSQNLVLRAGGPKRGKVALISGGGSGHEPLHGGYVGLGMLDAAAAGNVFTSPVPDQMEAATRAVDGGAGVLHIVKNYTGDVLNFQLAAELVGGEIDVATVVTNDDVAVQDSLYTAGRRGVGVTVLVEKMAGAHAEAGGSLADVTATAARVNDEGRSMGLALTSCVVPAAGTPTFDLPDDEVEVGIGIHGEPGLGLRQRDGRYAADRALRGIRQRREDPRRSRDRHRSLARRELHHEPRDGGFLRHAAAARRCADPLVGRARAHSRVALGRLTRARPERPPRSALPPGVAAAPNTSSGIRDRAVF